MNLNRTLYGLLAIFLLAAALRLINITNPLLGHHSWRQTDTAAIARNFIEERYNILYPKIDWRGATNGNVECEFPVYQFTLASIYRILGVHEIIGRLLSLVFSLATGLGVYLVSKRVATPSVGLWAAFFFAVLPMPIFFGRTVMPEAMLVAACTYAVLWFLEWARTNSLTFLFLSAAALTIACLIKPPTLYLGLPLAYFALRKHGRRAMTRPELWLFAAVVFGSLILWYTHAHQFKQTTGLTFTFFVWEHGSGQWWNRELVCSWEFWEKILLHRIFHDSLSYFGLPLLIIGLLTAPHSEDEKLFPLWLAGMLVFILVAPIRVFVHDYYLLPAAVPVSYFMGKAVSWGASKPHPKAPWIRIALGVCLIGIVVVSLNTYGKWLRREDPSKKKAFQAAQIADQMLPKGSLVIAVDKENPLMLYYSHRKGWHSSPQDLTPEFIADRAGQGADYILGVNNSFTKDGATENFHRLLRQYEVVVNNGVFFIVKITETP